MWKIYKTPFEICGERKMRPKGENLNINIGMSIIGTVALNMGPMVKTGDPTVDSTLD